MLRSLLTHPLARGRNLDDPRTTILRRHIIQAKPFLKRVYEEWYRLLSDSLDSSSERTLEIGSGAGFLQQCIPDLLTSDLLLLPWVDLVLDGEKIPFKDDVLDAMVFINVLHHIPDPQAFLIETSRCIRQGGKLVMIEPWVSTWSKLVYTNLHHEPFNPSARYIGLESHAPLSSANGALPWIMFERERDLILKNLSMWEITDIRLSTPFTYLLSGGMSMRSLMPGWSYGFWHRIETLLLPLVHHLAMFARITLTKRIV